jgi:hypothetical protein
MRAAAVLATGFAVLVFMAGVEAGPKGPAQWRCSVQLRDAATDMFKSDGGGPYVDGVAGVSCQIDRFTNWLYLSFQNKSRRSLVVIGQSNAEGSYSTITGGTSFDIKTIANAQAPLDVMPFRIRVSNPQFQDNFGQFSGDSSFGAGSQVIGTSSLFITTVDACTWQATLYTSGIGLQSLANGENASTETDPRVVLLSEAGAPGTNSFVARGHFVLPFAATVRVLSGKPGCPL